MGRLRLFVQSLFPGRPRSSLAARPCFFLPSHSLGLADWTFIGFVGVLVFVPPPLSDTKLALGFPRSGIYCLGNCLVTMPSWGLRVFVFWPLNEITLSRLFSFLSQWQEVGIDADVFHSGPSPFPLFPLFLLFESFDCSIRVCWMVGWYKSFRPPLIYSFLTPPFCVSLRLYREVSQNRSPPQPLKSAIYLPPSGAPDLPSLLSSLF